MKFDNHIDSKIIFCMYECLRMHIDSNPAHIRDGLTTYTFYASKPEIGLDKIELDMVNPENKHHYKAVINKNIVIDNDLSYKDRYIDEISNEYKSEFYERYESLIHILKNMESLLV